MPGANRRIRRHKARVPKPIEPAELNAVVACCRWPPSPARDAAVRDAVAAPLDWDLLGRIVARHRVEGLVHDGLRRAGVSPPPAVAAALAGAARGIAQENLRFAAASVRLSAALDAAAVPHLFVKGVTLGVLAYGSLGHKKSWDIDLAVEPGAYARACAVLADAGYAPVEHEGEVANKHSEWADAARVTVELHASLVDNALIMPGLSVLGPRQEVAVAGGATLPTLAGDELFAYLCVHGGAHAWSRLKWLADVAALIAPADEAEVARLYARSQAMGAGRSVGQALLLCADLFGRELPPKLEASLRGDPIVRALVRAARGSMTRGGADVELDSMVLGTVPIHATHFFLQRGWRYKWLEARRKLGGGGALGPAARLTGWLSRRSRTAAAPPA